MNYPERVYVEKIPRDNYDDEDVCEENYELEVFDSTADALVYTNAQPRVFGLYKLEGFVRLTANVTQEGCNVPDGPNAGGVKEDG